jgi:flagellar basal body-associated protein FliL
MSDASAPGPRAREKRSLAFLLWPLLALSVASGAWYWHSSVEANAAAAPGSRVHSVLHLETFVLNLSGGEERAYLRVGVDLGLRDEMQGKGATPVPVALVRDTILSVLATARPDDVLTGPGKQALKAELLRALRERAPGLGVEEVYLTEFLIQR